MDFQCRFCSLVAMVTTARDLCSKGAAGGDLVVQFGGDLGDDATEARLPRH